jgi:hypothetical protein
MFSLINIMIEWLPVLPVLLRVIEVPLSNLGLEIDDPD